MGIASKEEQALLTTGTQKWGRSHHGVYEHWHQEAEDGCAVADLCAVDGAIPCCPTVDQLIAQNVEPVKNETQPEVLSVGQALALSCLPSGASSGFS